MKKLICLLIVLLVIYFGLEISFTKLSKGHNIEYKIVTNKKEFKVKEIYTNKKSEKKNYYFEVENNDIVYNFQTFENFNSSNYIIKEIISYEDDNYSCIYPTFKGNKNIIDIICKKNDVQYFYSSIKNEDIELDKFVSSLENYNKNNYRNNTKNKIEATPVTLYVDNILDNHYISLSNYKGLYLINKKDNIKNISLFKNDVYETKINELIDKNYVVANYNNEYKFNELYVINIKNGKESKIISDDSIKLDSYSQGHIEDDLYIFDRSNKEQYRINIKNKTINKIGNTSSGIQIYNNNEFKTGSAYDAYNNNVLFNEHSYNNVLDDKTYSKIDIVGNYYYLFEKDNDYYNVYRVNNQNKNILTYLFKTTDINNIDYYDNFIYFKNKDALNYFEDNKGIKTLLKNSEFKFNNTIKFGLYVES